MGLTDLVTARQAVRERIAARALAAREDPERMDALHQENWTDLNSVFCKPLAMGLYYMPDVYSIWPAHWHDYVLRQYMSGKHCAIAGPRRRGKSKTWQLYQLYKMLTLDWTYSLHICLSPELVLQHSTSVIEQLDTNKRLQEAFGILPGKVTQQEHFEVTVGKAHRTKLQFEWMTRDGRPRGTGLHGIGVDDIDDSSDSPYVMQKYNDHIHSAVFGALEDFENVIAQIIALGNMTGRGCNMRKFQTIDAKLHPDRWIVMVIPAIEMGKTQEITLTPVGESTWPDRFTTEATKQRIADMNVTKARAGDMELQNEFVDVSDLIWTEPMFEKTWEILPPSHQSVLRVYIDSSQKVKEAGDEWGIVTVYKAIDGPRKGEYGLVRGRLSALQPDDAADEVIQQFLGSGHSLMPQCEAVCMESKTDKGEDPFLALLKLKARQRNINIPTYQLVPVGDKRQRALAAAPIGRSGALRVPVNPDTDLLQIIEQMKNFTGKSDPHMKAVDDGHDAVVWGLNDLQPITAKQSAHIEPIKVKGRVRAVA